MTDICENKHGGNQLSSLAYRSLPKRSLGKTRHAILSLANARGIYGITAHEVAAQLGLRQASASARMSELKREKRLVDSGARRKTDTGRLSAVFVLEKFLEPTCSSCGGPNTAEHLEKGFSTCVQCIEEMSNEALNLR